MRQLLLLAGLLVSALPAALAQTARPERCTECPEMVELPAGEFIMGSEAGDKDERPEHQVSVRAFLIGKTEVTQEQWAAVMGTNPSKFIDCDDCPVENVSWDDVKSYIQKLNSRTGRRFRLPSEAEWEYACRAGGVGIYCGGNDVDRLAWTDSDRASGGETHAVAQKQANAFGLYDMCGNVWEWVEDCWNASYGEAPVDGSAWLSGDCGRRVLRGGSWGFEPQDARATSRFKTRSSARNFYLGFRLAHSLDGRNPAPTAGATSSSQ